MAITSVLINVADIDRSVDFYSRYLGVVPVEVTDRTATLDAVTATITLLRVDEPEASTWVADDLQRGFRHVGFKVADLDSRVAALHDGDVPFHLEPIDAEGDVRITFFYDPDGTLVEMVEGALNYQEIYDQGEVDNDWALGVPDRPRFDHVAETVVDAHASHTYFEQLGFALMGGIHQPSDPRGFEITYLHDGDTSIEIFEYSAADNSERAPQPNATGFLAAEFGGEPPRPAMRVGEAHGRELYADADGLVFAIERS